MDPLLRTETLHPDSVDLDTLAPERIALLMERANQEAVDAVRAIRIGIAEAIATVRDAFMADARLIYIGAGTSGRLGALDASECPPTFSAEPGRVVGLIAGGDRALRHAVENAEDVREAGARDLEGVDLVPADVVCGITASGRTPYVLGALSHARSVGAKTLLVTMNPDSPARGDVDHLLCAQTGPELVSGSTRLKAGTATKLILNALTTGAFALSGRVYSNRMVDLRPGSSKLVRRGTRILAQLLDLDEDRARHLLSESGDRVKVALLMGARGLDRTEAESRLSAHRGFLRAALEGQRLPGEDV